LPNVFRNGSSSIRKTAPAEEPEPESFLEKPEPCQTNPNLRSLERIDGVGVGGATTYVVNMDCNGYWLGVVTSVTSTEWDDQDAKQLQLA
jgi:hypothetical protein